MKESLKQFKNGFKLGFRNFNSLISVIINSILLSLVYILGVGSTWLFAKLTHKDFLDLEIKKKVASYWVNLNLKKVPRKNYYRQF